MAKKVFEQEENCFVFECPACGCNHYFLTAPKLPAWTWNANAEQPTVSPSIRVGGTKDLTEEQYQQIRRGEPFTPEPHICHFFIKEGKIEFCGDSTHEFAGKTVEMLDWE